MNQYEDLLKAVESVNGCSDYLAEQQKRVFSVIRSVSCAKASGGSSHSGPQASLLPSTLNQRRLLRKIWKQWTSISGK